VFNTIVWRREFGEVENVHLA